AARPRALAGATVALLATFCAFDGVLAWHAHAIRPNENVPPRRTIAFIREHTRPGDVLAARYRETFAWHTSRFAIDVGFHPDPDAWFHELARHRVRYVVNHPEGETMESVRQDRLRASSRLILERLEDPSRFRFAFRAEGEPFTVHELLGAEAFERGYAHLLKFHEALAADDLPGARAALEAARKTGAAITRLPFYLGTTEMLSGRPKEARRRLEEAVLREPAFAPARRNLERVLEK
ncbi:MAG: hypothetical protein HY553_11950, partial [Elusimicrobia bacterium]|nr:hypothetical protein [Elusimicrobiota bacterium]